MKRFALLAAISLLLPAFISTSALAGSGAAQSPGKPIRFVRAFVIDDRISALRREADIQAEVIQRPRLGRQLHIMQSGNNDIVRGPFVRVALSRRTRGWIHRSAIAVPGRAGEDERILKLVESRREELDRLTLSRLLIDRFPRSPLLARALLAIGEEAERSSSTLARHARQRLSDLKHREAPVRDYYLNDTGLDRYSRLGVHFDFNETTGKYVYDGHAYREIIRRFPTSEEAGLARQKLDKVDQKLARQTR